MRRAVSRPVCADETNPALSVDRKFRGASTVGPHTAQPAPAVAPHDPPRQADACRSAIGRPILIEGDTVVVSSDKVAAPASVRYAFTWNPSKRNLYGRNGLPVAPFRTDNW